MKQNIGYVQNQEYRNRERNAGNAVNRENVIFRGMSSNIPGNVLKHSGECPRKIQRIFKNDLWYVVKHSVESMKGFGWMYIIALDTGDHELYLFIEELLLIKSTSKQLG